MQSILVVCLLVRHIIGICHESLGALGGWTILENAERFGEYMGFIARNFGEDLENLVSINEPWCVAWLSHYLGEHAPGLRDLSCAKASHFVCLGHGLGIQAARAETKKPIGIVLNFTLAVWQQE